jgi:hypothetical protein
MSVVQRDEHGIQFSVLAQTCSAEDDHEYEANEYPLWRQHLHERGFRGCVFAKWTAVAQIGSTHVAYLFATEHEARAFEIGLACHHAVLEAHQQGRALREGGAGQVPQLKGLQLESVYSQHQQQQ